MKIIFLDVDGVLNCLSTKDRILSSYGIEDKKVLLLKKIVDETKAKIVLVSTWKQFWYKKKENKIHQDVFANYLDKKLKKQGLHISAKTTDQFLNRGDGISLFLKNLKKISKKEHDFIILDDEVFDYEENGFLPNLIHTSVSDGLTEEKAEQAILLLNKKAEN